MKMNMKKRPLHKEELRVLVISGIGMFLSTLDSGIINVAIPSLTHYFDASIQNVTMVISLYFIVLSSTIVGFGKFGDYFGRLKIFKFGILIFGVSSLMCALPATINQLIIWRCIQAIGASAMQATAVALVTTLVAPANRAFCLGTLGLVIGAGPIVGPTVSGIILSISSWRWLFIINIPICIVGYILSVRIKDIAPDKKKKFNFLGCSLLAAIIIALTALVSTSFSGQYVKSILGLLILILISCGFLISEARTDNPIGVSFLYKKFNFYLNASGTLAFGFSIATVLYVSPIFLSYVCGFEFLKIGFIVFFAPLGIMVASKITGNLLLTFSEKALMLVGLLLMFFSALLLYIFVKIPVSLFVFILFTFGLGGGVFLPSNISSTMKLAEPYRQGTIGAINRMLHNLANGFGAFVSSVVIQSKIENHIHDVSRGIKNAWLIATISLFLTTIFYFKKIYFNRELS